jgi:hypothetical protein
MLCHEDLAMINPHQNTQNTLQTAQAPNFLRNSLSYCSNNLIRQQDKNCQWQGLWNQQPYGHNKNSNILFFASVDIA